MNYIPLHCHSHYSLLDGLSQPEHMSARIEEIESTACALTDHGTISGAIAFMREMKGRGLKPILGCELYCSPNNKARPNAHLPILTKNDKGWRQLVQIVSKANHPDNFYYKPRVSVNELQEYLDGNIVGFSGHLGSHISNAIEEGEDSERVASILQDVFGKGNFFLEVQLMDSAITPKQRIIAEQVREISKKLGIPLIATPDAHYATKAQALDQRILLCTNMHITMERGRSKDFQLSTFFNSDNFHIPSHQEMLDYGHTEEELANTNLISDMVEDYDDILQSPILPPFDCPDGLNPDTYLLKLCEEGMHKAPAGKEANYRERMNEELSILQGAGLSSYFLIVADMLAYVKRQDWLAGPGRGSAAGCLVSYLTGITSIDPLQYQLMFERFYNAGRNTGGHISMPDIDIDIPADNRDEIIQYVKNKYGQGKVGQMITYQTMMGRRALKDVLRAYGEASFDEMNRITQQIPDKAKIAGELQEMKDNTGSSSVIQWALENQPEKFEEWVRLNDKDELEGPLANRFSQAIRLEGTKAAQSKHAAGIVIGNKPLNEIAPMVYDTKTQTQVVGFEMEDVESIGLIKYDILGLNFLDKVSGISKILNRGEI